MALYVFLIYCCMWLHYQAGRCLPKRRILCISWNSTMDGEPGYTVIIIWWQAFIGVKSWQWAHFLHMYGDRRVTLNEEYFGWIFMKTFISMDSCNHILLEHIHLWHFWVKSHMIFFIIFFHKFWVTNVIAIYLIQMFWVEKFISNFLVPIHSHFHFITIRNGPLHSFFK